MFMNKKNDVGVTMLKILPSTLFMRNLWQTVTVFIISISIFIIYVWSAQMTKYADDQLIEATLLADELRMTTNGLTRMARGYIVKGDPVYKQGFQKIIDIRDGLQPRPSGHHQTYWDLILPGEKNYFTKTSETVSLLELIRRIGITKAEFAKLAEAKTNADAMSRMEMEAMSIADSAQANRDKALFFLDSIEHHNAKVAVRDPIDDFYTMLNTRLSGVHNKAEMLSHYLLGVFALMALLSFFMLWRIYKTTYAILGTSVDNLHACIRDIGNGNFSTPIVVESGMEDSVAQWLSKMQIKLKELLLANERLKNLYSALSQCNNAIVRHKNEKELFSEICRIAVNFGGMKMAWIGMLDEENSQIKPVAFYGKGTDYLEGVAISTNPADPSSQGPSGRAFHDNNSYWCQDFVNDSLTLLWHERGREFGWGASAALPLVRNGVPVGVFNLYAENVGAFDEPSQKLLKEMAMDIGFALDTYASEAVRTKIKEQIEYMAHFDFLTGLPNRTQLQDRFAYTMNLAKRQNGYATIMFIDLDHFKEVNDSLGHSVGDILLVEIAKRLLSVLREEDTLSRMGGDEFTLLLPDTDYNGALQVAQKLLDIFDESFLIDKYELTLSVSIGIAIFPIDGADKETLFKNADSAMYRAKKEGRNRYCFFTEEMQQNSMRKLSLSNALRHALKRNELEVVYQPQISTGDGKIIGAEALLRWHHPELGSISPVEFISIAEENGMILSIGEWVLRTAVTQAKTWMQKGMPPRIMAVNISAVQFHHSNLQEVVMKILNEVGLSPEYLELELTEGMAMQNPKKAIEIMNNLYAEGIRMSIDDFGTGYSSLSYLKKFKIYKLKIDQSFIHDITTDTEDKAIVVAIIAMAKSLGLQTIAEGVETLEQLEHLHEHGCDEIQGYYYSKPLSVEAFEIFSQKISILKDGSKQP